MRITVNPASFNPAELAPAVDALRRDGLIAYPTETVYGLGASTRSQTAVRRIFEIKVREQRKPISVMICEPSAVAELCNQVTECARRLMAQFWPGPVTLVLQASACMPEYLQSGTGSVGIRCPNHPLSMALVRLLGAPITSTSANLSGQPPPVDADDVVAQLGQRPDCLIDGGACPGQTPSTVVDVTGDRPVLLRQGAIGFEEIQRYAHGDRE